MNEGVTLDLNELTVANGSGGIFNLNGTLTVSNSTFSGNSGGTYSSGGGIHNRFGGLTVSNKFFTSNSADYGGGIYNDYDGGTVTISNSAFLGGSADFGGSIYNRNRRQQPARWELRWRHHRWRWEPQLFRYQLSWHERRPFTRPVAEQRWSH